MTGLPVVGQQQLRAGIATRKALSVSPNQRRLSF